MKDLIKFELSVLIEKNKPTNERKLTAEIEKASAGGEVPGGKELLERGRFGLAFAAFE